MSANKKYRKTHKFSQAVVTTALLLLSSCESYGPEEVRGVNFGAPSIDFSRQQFFPQGALAARVQGFVLMLCDTNPQGRLENCEVAFESQAGWGFGAAALDMSSQIVIRDNPAAIGGRVVQPAFFCLDQIFCQRARAQVEQFKQERARLKIKTPLE